MTSTKTWIYFIDDYWVGECEGIPLRTNVEELKGNLVEFSGETRQSVIDQIKSYLGVNSLWIQ